MNDIVHMTVSGTGAPSALGVKRVIANFLLFQIAWIVCVVSAARHVQWLSLFVIAIAIGAYVVSSQHKLKAVSLILFCMMMGVAIESLLATIRATQFNDHLNAGGGDVMVFAPAWMAALWGLFATTFNVSLRWLNGRYVLSSLLGAIAGPLSYLSGSKMGALILPADYSLLAIGLCWAVMMPVLLSAAKHWDAFA
ncbi:MAG: DUF2878 domain-containing protein [Steroidobacter sp.]